MNRQQIIQEKDKIVSNLFDGIFLDDSGKALGNRTAQALRQRALNIFMKQDLHHGDLGQIISDFTRENFNKLSTKKITNKLAQFYIDAAKLNVDSGQSIFRFAGSGHGNIIKKFEEASPTLEQATNFVERNIKNWQKNASSGNVNFKGAAKSTIDSLTRRVIRAEVVRGIRHVFPESVEQRVLMNHGLDIIELLENIEADSMWKDELDVAIEWNQIGVEPQNFKGKRQYTPPQNLSELRDMHRWWTNEFNIKAKEYVLGDNVYLLGDELTENITMNDAYHQYAGLGQRGDVVPPIVQLLDDKLPEVLQSVTRKLGVETLTELALEHGVDPNDLNVYAQIDFKTNFEYGSMQKVKELTKQKVIDFIEYNSNASDKLLPALYPEVEVKGMTNQFPNTQIYSMLEGPINDADLSKNRINITDVLEGEVTSTTISDAPTIDTPTNVETFNVDDYKSFNLEVTDPAGLHAGPSAKLINDLKNQGLKVIVMENGVLKEVGMTGLLKRGLPLGSTLELYVPKDLISIDMGDGSDGYKVKLDNTPPNQTLRVMEDASLSISSDRIRKVAQDYHKLMGYSDPEFKPAMIFNDELGAAASDVFEKLPMFDEAAIPYYRKFIQETNMQYQTLLDAGIQFEIVDVDPYSPNKVGHQLMINDMENGRLKVLATEAGFGDGTTSKLNPMLAESRYQDVNGRVMLENDVFRAVHDTFGHGMRGNTFGPIGEYNAWLAHKEMYSSDARRVMTTETLGQNTFTNYGPHMRDANGNLLGKADAGYIKPADRPFASPKVALMPEEIITAAGNVVEDVTEIVDKNGVDKTAQLANTNPEMADSLWKTSKKIVGKAFNTAAGVLDPGDIAITQGLARVLPRIGLAAISAPALAAYVFYELSVLTVDAAQAFDKGLKAQNIELLDYDNTNPDINWRQLGKDTWSEFGEISDTWSLSWKISEPIIDYAFNEAANITNRLGTNTAASNSYYNYMENK